MLNCPPETDADPRLLGGACVVAEDLDRVDEAELLALELLDEEGLLLVVENNLLFINYLLLNSLFITCSWLR